MSPSSALENPERLPVPHRPIVVSSGGVLAEEINFYESNKLRFIEDHKGEWILVRGSEIIGYYATCARALKEGYKRFGDKDFLIKEVSDLDQTINIGTLFLTKI